MKIMWCGTASLLLESGDTRLLIDPYLRKFDRAGAPFPVEEARQAEAIFITHPHIDHFCDTDFFSEGKRPVYVSARGIALARRNGLDTSVMRELRAGESVAAGAFTVTAYRGRHCAFDAATVFRVLFSPRTWLHFADAARLLSAAKRYVIPMDEIFVFHVTDGEKSVVVLGSAGMAEGEAYPKGADLLVFPYQGRAGMHREIKPFLDVFAPENVMIDHFDDAFPPVSKRVGTKKFPSAVNERLPKAQALVPEINVWYDVL